MTPRLSPAQRRAIEGEALVDLRTAVAMVPPPVAVTLLIRVLAATMAIVWRRSGGRARRSSSARGRAGRRRADIRGGGRRGPAAAEPATAERRRAQGQRDQAGG